MSSKAGETINGSENGSVKEEIQEVDFREWKNEIHVDKKGEKGAYKSIQAAINATTPT